MNMEIAFTITLDTPFDQAEERVTAALKEEGFGVLTRIDVRETLKEKLGEQFRPYLILGACNPPLAHRALQIEPQIGVMLPCNVTIEAVDSTTVVRFANPEAMLTMGVENKSEDLIIVANEARRRIERVAASIQTR